MTALADAQLLDEGVVVSARIPETHIKLTQHLRLEDNATAIEAHHT